MKLKQIKFYGIRNFTSETIFDFSGSKSITSISGKNGSGKTTIFKSLVLCQKAFFINQLSAVEATPYMSELDEELSKYFIRKGAFIEVSFEFPDELNFDYSFRVSCIEHTSQHVKWQLDCETAMKEGIQRCWNFKNPSEIIVFVDLDKHFFEKDVSHESISVKIRSNNQLLVDIILSPERLFSNVYQSLINDYLKERLVPAKPRRDIYFLPTKIFLKSLLPQVTLSNFTGQQFQDQFVLLGKAASGSNNYFDIRNFSSGEKTLFYILLFINYVQRIGLLIIDEPENHFHEELLVKFIELLKEVCVNKSPAAVIENLAKKAGFILTKINTEEIEKYYENYNLSQVFLLTHSKNLIYNNFTVGTNYYLDNRLVEIEYELFEKTLREIGLSSIYLKVLFVEGETETDYLDLFFNEHNIKVHSLNGCGAVIDTYNRFLQIKTFLKDYHFFFLIDRDTRSEESLNKIRSKDQGFFDEHFIVLGRHEFENYLLDADIFYQLIEKYSRRYDDSKMLRLVEVENKIKEVALEEKQHVVRKTLNKKNHDTIDELKSKFVNKHVPFGTLDEYSGHLDQILYSENIEATIKNRLIENYNETIDLLKESTWASDWLKLCDGKIVLNKVVRYFSSHLEIMDTRLKKEIKQIIFLPTSQYEIKSIVAEDLKKFNAAIPNTKELAEIE